MVHPADCKLCPILCRFATSLSCPKSFPTIFSNGRVQIDRVRVSVKFRKVEEFEYIRLAEN